VCDGVWTPGSPATTGSWRTPATWSRSASWPTARPRPIRPGGSWPFRRNRGPAGRGPGQRPGRHRTGNRHQEVLCDKGSRSGWSSVGGHGGQGPPGGRDRELTETGNSLRANNLRIVDTVVTSTTRFIANRQAWGDPFRREKIENIAILLRAAIEARTKVGLKMNVRKTDLDAVLGCCRPRRARRYRAWRTPITWPSR